MKLLPTCFLAGRLCSIGAGSIALVLSPLPSSPLLSSTDSKIGSNSSMSSARSHERSVCQAGAEEGYDLPAAEKSRSHSADMGSSQLLHFSALAFSREPSPKFGSNLWALTGG